jgi:hypothetical protein
MLALNLPSILLDHMTLLLISRNRNTNCIQVFLTRPFHHGLSRLVQITTRNRLPWQLPLTFFNLHVVCEGVYIDFFVTISAQFRIRSTRKGVRGQSLQTFITEALLLAIDKLGMIGG